MYSKKFNYDALPIEVIESQLKDNEKRILNVFFKLNNLDKTKENGFFFISNKDLVKESGVSEPTIISKVSLFESTYNFIKRTAGDRIKGEDSKASTYILYIPNIIEWCINHKKESNTKKINTKKSENFSNENLSIDLEETITKIIDTRINEFLSIINLSIKEQNADLIRKIEDLLNTKKINTKKMEQNFSDRNFSTDIDIDSSIPEIEKELELNNNNTSHIIGEEKENTKIDMTSNVMSYDTINEDNEKENKEPDTSMTSTDSDDSGNNISSIEENTDTSNVEYRNNIHSNEVIDEENKLIKTSIETMQRKSQNISSNNNNILTPAPRLKEDNRREISDNNLTDYLKDKLKSAKERFNQGQEEIGWIIFDDTLKYLNKHYKNLNIELINSIRNEYQDYINANKAVPDVSNTADNKSINEEIKTCQEANKEPKKAYNKYPCENYEEKIMKLQEKVLEKLHQEEDIEPAYNLMKEQFDKIYKDYDYPDKTNLAIMNNILNAEANKYGYGWL